MIHLKQKSFEIITLTALFHSAAFSRNQIKKVVACHLWHNSGLLSGIEARNRFASHYVTAGHDGHISKYTPRQYYPEP